MIGTWTLIVVFLWNNGATSQQIPGYAGQVFCRQAGELLKKEWEDGHEIWFTCLPEADEQGALLR